MCYNYKFAHYNLGTTPPLNMSDDLVATHWHFWFELSPLSHTFTCQITKCFKKSSVFPILLAVQHGKHPLKLPPNLFVLAPVYISKDLSLYLHYSMFIFN